MTADRLREWLKSNGWTATRLAKEIGTSLATITYICRKEREPSAFMRDAIEKATGGAIKAADWANDEAAVANCEEPPASGQRGIVEPAKLGTTREELEDIAARCKALARVPGLSPREQAALEGQRRAAMSELRRLDESAKIEDHPDFPQLVDDMLRALEATLAQHGVNPDGARSSFAAHLERIEAQRQRRAA